MHKSAALASTPLFHTNSTFLSSHDRVALSYDRTRAIGALHALSAQDILTVSPKYWEYLRDPIHVMDGAAATLLTIHLNLCIGTIAMFPEGKEQLLKRLLAFELSGQYCLTEVGHGLDAYHLETTATLLPTGELEINTPNEAAAKYMPPTTPAGLPGIAVVFARLLVNGQDRGVKPVLVPLHDGRKMHPGVISKLLSPRGGSGPVDHALTYFRHVRVPGSSLLGSLEKGADPKGTFAHNIFRVVVGTLGMGTVALSMMRIASYIATKYSMRRIVVDSFTGKPKPIMAFSTQKTPVLTAIAQTLVMDAYCTKVHQLWSTGGSSLQQHFVAAVWKATIVPHSLSILSSLGDRCGAQGLFEVNQISMMHADVRGASIAEGDTLGISIRFAIELILGKVTPAPYLNPGSLLSRHEQQWLSELRSIVKGSKTHRSNAIESSILPRCQELLQAVGHRIAVDAAVELGVDPAVVDLYVASVVKQDSAWYSENLGLTQEKQRRMERDAVDALYPKLESLLEKLAIADYVNAPIVSDEAWVSHVRELPVFQSGKAAVEDSVQSRL
ncbi:acyl-CoA dehydrogenase NM domain-like protein [Roridomyces roridus]|uniref:Acyl-CoA dehydrogenase NM domain-like protein n=1 Tax=Roridomyces roridus TaxID=1738132 RepID=A0AAD7B6A8_9AGAR|nr:acyl-CoA dehydrogenase NM domain-like protein [Roridomyces roridus]